MGGRGGAGTAGASGSRGPHGGRPAPRAPPELAPGPPAAADARRGAASGRNRSGDPGQRPAPGSAPTQPGKGRTGWGRCKRSARGGRTARLRVSAGGVWAPWILETGIPRFRLWVREESGSQGAKVPGFLRQGRLGSWDSRRFTSQALASFKRQQEQGFQEQSALAAEARETRRQELLEKIAEGQAAKKQKLEQESVASESQEASANPAAAESEAGASQAPGEPEEAGSSSPQPGPSNGVAPLPRSALLVQLATARPRPIKARPLDWRVQSKDWPHAGRPAHELRYSIYRDLWERGFFLSAAGKFGGDFLVYPGDPLRFHAHYIAQCWAPGDPIPLQDLVSAGRLGTSVRKTLLLCSPQPDGKVVYTSLQWASLQ
uniref:tRNA-splicing endonuclease subunit SEN34 n=1 Tax=Canis lupus familiaris TaxID=9615 RepID=A0A8C0LWY1_CANLF